MKKIILVITILTILIGCSKNNNKINCNDKPKLYSSYYETKKNSHVKKIDIKVNYSKEIQEKCGGLKLNTIYKYDERGNEIEMLEQGELKYINFYDYNSNGKLISKLQQDPLGNLSTTRSYRYDLKGNEISHYFKNHNSLTSYLASYTYDNSNNLTQKVETSSSYGNNGTDKYTTKSVRKHKYKYDDDNKIEEIWESDGETMGRYIYEYDNQGNVSKVFSYDAKGLLMEAKIKMYNSQGKLILDSLIDKGKDYLDFGLGDSFRFKYDKKGNIIEKTSYSSTYGYERKNSYTYDEVGNKIEDIIESDKNLVSYKYIYDKNDNWTFQTYYINGIPQYEVNREIEYFDKNKNISTIDKVFEYDEKRRLYVNNKIKFSVKVPLDWEHDYGVTNNNIFRTFQKDSSFFVAIGVDKNKNYLKINSHSFLDSYGEEKLKREVLNGYKNQGLNINPKSIKIRKSYLKNVESIKLEYTFKRYYEDFSFDISMQQHVFLRGENKITISCSSPSVFLDANLTSFEYLTSLFHHLPFN